MCDENMNLEEKQVTEPVEPKVETEPLFEEMVDFDTFSKSDFRVVKVKECSAVKKSKKLLHFVLMMAQEQTELFSLESMHIMNRRNWSERHCLQSQIYHREA